MHNNRLVLGKTVVLSKNAQAHLCRTNMDRFLAAASSYAAKHSIGRPCDSCTARHNVAYALDMVHTIGRLA